MLLSVLIFGFTVAMMYTSSVLQEDTGQFPDLRWAPSVHSPLRPAMAGEARPQPVPGELVPPLSSQPMEEGAGKQPSSEDLEKISISYGIEKEFFTIQAASYLDAASAERGYTILEHDLHGEDLDQLRIEVVGPYHALRLGAFENRAPARSLLGKVKKPFPTSLVLSAYIKPERIMKIHARPLAP